MQYTTSLWSLFNKTRILCLLLPVSKFKRWEVVRTNLFPYMTDNHSKIRCLPKPCPARAVTGYTAVNHIFSFITLDNKDLHEVTTI